MENYVLPDIEVLFDNMLATTEATETELQVIRNYLSSAAKNFVSAMKGIDDSSFFRDEPTVQEENLRNYHLITGGLIGLTNSVIKRLKFLSYFQLTDEAKDLDVKLDKKKGLTVGDRENYSRGKCAFEESLLAQLENIQSNINGRLVTLRNHSFGGGYHRK